MRSSIGENYQRLRAEIPQHVTIVVAAKERTVEEIREVVSAGATDIGENYVQEAERAYVALGETAKEVRSVLFARQLKVGWTEPIMPVERREHRSRLRLRSSASCKR